MKKLSCNIPYILMLIGIFCLFNLPLLIKRGHSYAVALLFIGSLFGVWRYRKNIILKQDKAILLVFVSYALISLSVGLYHEESLRTLEHSLKFLLVIPIALYLFSYPPSDLFIFICAGLGATTSGFMALWDKFYLGIPRASEHLNAIFFAEVCLLLVVFCLCGVKLANKIQSRYKRYFYIFLMLFGAFSATVAAILSASRGAWIALPVILVGIAMLYQLTKRQTFIFLSFCSLLLASSYFIPQTGVKHRVQQAIAAFQPNTKEFSVSARLNIWKASIPMITKQPLLGWGETGAEKEKQQLVKHKQAHLMILHIGHWHSLFIEKVVKQGLIGLLALIVLFLVPLMIFIKMIQQCQIEEDRVLAYCGVLVILSHMVFGLSDTILKYNLGTIFYCLPVIILWATIRKTYDSVSE